MSAEDVLDLDDSFQSWSGLSRNASNQDVGGSRTHLVDSDEEEVDHIPWKGGPFPRASSHPQAQQDDRTKRDSSLQEAAKRRLPSFENIQQHCSTGRFDLLWRLMSECIPEDKVSIQREIVRHVEYTLACTRLNFAKKHAFQATAHSLRDRMVERFNDTEQLFDDVRARRVYYLSLEFLMGRTLSNCVHSLGLVGKYSEALDELGFQLEELYEEEKDAALGNGGLGRLAACFMDSLATLNYPAWGYGLRYSYGLFEQRIHNDSQIELPDCWLTDGNPWEVERLDVQYSIRFYGHVNLVQVNGRIKSCWEGGDLVQAVAYDNLIPGHRTRNTLNLRLWASRPTRQLDMELFNEGDYQGALDARQRSENITSVLYPNDSSYSGKELRLKQQYFLVAATIRDILARFSKTQESIIDLAKHVCIQLNDTHPALGIVELLRILLDEEDLPWDQAWDITTNIFNYTNHTVLPEALEKWSVSMIERLIPRHMQLIWEINHRFLQLVSLRWPDETSRLAAMSIIEEPGAGKDGVNGEKLVRMTHLAIVGSKYVNGVAEMHTEILKQGLFRVFYELWDHKFQNKTNGVTPRRWLQQANPALSKLLSLACASDSWCWDMSLLRRLRSTCNDSKLQEQWRAVKRGNKQRLAMLIDKECGVKLDLDMLYDVQVKRIHEYKRQLLNVVGIIHRYSELKRMRRDAPGLLAVVPRAFILGGKAAPGYYMAKLVLKLILHVAKVVNADKDTNQFLKVVFIPNYNVKLAEIIIPGSDISQHLSTAGTEASGTSNMKFAMNGCLLLATLDGATAEIRREVGEDNVFIFGSRAQDVERIRKEQRNQCCSWSVDPRFYNALSRIREGDFGPPSQFEDLLESLRSERDQYLVGVDFGSYLEAQARVDRTWQQPEEWTRKSILCCAGMAKFSSDNTIRQYAEDIWKVR
ncbi:glucan phosphorylase [Guillardia theta CCMP2712]|uniref:Alpha-1,4 glucan phosphorylase n=1 Tax=Guillardia theta (strain CCMP2712) TaxID=905079 RepID=L1IAQ5_GUITC|nr:glucan phosphorylase [Guillardia theta CCMP2712]EKX33321.1 glucan phosphorylase [Guillardia theta CCMP2712]|eukprot:XP_005820301.1 glucan phosphorylase [Guillardia theta CCMP2712]